MYSGHYRKTNSNWFLEELPFMPLTRAWHVVKKLGQVWACTSFFLSARLVEADTPFPKWGWGVGGGEDEGGEGSWPGGRKERK